MVRSSGGISSRGNDCACILVVDVVEVVVLRRIRRRRGGFVKLEGCVRMTRRSLKLWVNAKPAASYIHDK
jgi:hypothetical protein